MFRLLRTLFLIATLVFALGASTPPNGQVAAAHAQNDLASWQVKIAPQVLAQAASGPTEFLVVLKAQADLSAAYKLPTKAEKGAYVYQQLSQLAARTQKPVLAELKALGASYRPFWVTNMIWVRGDAASVQAMAQRADVARLDANPWIKQDLPQPVQAPFPQGPAAVNSIQWNINYVNAPQVWATGYNGQGVVIGGQDTGYRWDHEALKDHYRGWDGSTADHNYNWHDAIHSGGIPSCPKDSKVPCDDFGHGTHTMGTMLGEDPAGAHQIGMAPGARWIGCRNMNGGVGSPASYSECFQWFIAPTDLNDQNPRPDLAPDVINNSWGCTTYEGCTSWDTLQAVVDNTRAAGIVVVASAGNSGPGCNTVHDPPAMYGSVFTVGATSYQNDQIAGFSSRGPGAGTNLLKPDVTAPGVSVLSSTITGDYGYLSGTSMAAPHVSGLVALMISADPLLRGNVDAIEDIIRQSSVPLTTTQDCGTMPGTLVPNNTFGYGRIDAWKAFTQLPHLLAISASAPPFVSPNDPITYTLTVTHTHPLTPTFNVQVSATISTQTYFLSASGSPTINGSNLQWTFPQLGINQSQSVQFVVQAPNVYRTISNVFQVRSDQVADPINSEPVTTTVGMRDFFPILIR
jgi:serine protease AprX